MPVPRADWQIRPGHRAVSDLDPFVRIETQSALFAYGSCFDFLM